MEMEGSYEMKEQIQLLEESNKVLKSKITILESKNGDLEAVSIQHVWSLIWRMYRALTPIRPALETNPEKCSKRRFGANYWWTNEKT